MERMQWCTLAMIVLGGAVAGVGAGPAVPPRAPRLQLPLFLLSVTVLVSVVLFGGLPGWFNGFTAGLVIAELQRTVRAWQVQP